MHDLGEQTKRLLDLAAVSLAGVSAITRVISLSDVALVVTIAAGVLSGACAIVRLYDRFRYGRSAAAAER